jgi:hypothetical protein
MREGQQAMTPEEIIAMAREAGFELADNATDEALNRFRAFAALASEAERKITSPGKGLF